MGCLLTVVGFVLFLGGALFSMTGIGLIIGVPLMIIGLPFLIIGGLRLRTEAIRRGIRDRIRDSQKEK